MNPEKKDTHLLSRILNKTKENLAWHNWHPISKTVVKIFPVLLIVLSIPLTVNLSQKEQNLNSNAAPSVTASDKENSLKSFTARLFALNRQYSQDAQNGTLLNNLSDIASQRKEILLDIIRNDPELALRSALSQQVKNEMKPQIQPQIEENIKLAGKIEHLHSDDFDHNISKHYFYLNTASEKLSLHFSGEIPEELLTGADVSVQGIRLGNDIALRAQDLLISPPPVLGASTSNSSLKKVAVILLNFTNDTSQPYTTDFAREAVFTGSASVNNLYKESSFGAFEIQGSIRQDGDIYGWYTVPYTNTVCDTSAWSSAAATAAKANGYVSSNYTNTVYAFSGTPCPWSGIATLGGVNSYINSGGAGLMRNIAHEIGHNFGLQHATNLNCVDSNGTKVAMSSTCTNNEYGDIFDVMGSYNRQFNNFHKGAMKWLSSANTYTLTQTSGTYTLNLTPLEQASTGYQAIRIPRDTNVYYYLEFRQPFGGFDNFSPSDPVVNGVSIRLSTDYKYISGKTRLIDNAPYTLSVFDSALPANATFYDPIKGLTIKTISVSSTGATVQITFGQQTCAHSNPTISINPLSQWTDAGKSLSYTISVKNNDSAGCSPSTFTLVPQLPATDWSQVENITNLPLSPGASGNSIITVKSPTTVTEGLYTFSVSATNSGFPSYTASSSANYNVYQLTITVTPTLSPTPTLILSPTGTTDTTPPTVSIKSPANGSSLPNGGQVKVTVAASDTSGLSNIQIILDGTLVNTCQSNTSCEYRWQVNKTALGTHTITAVATDNSPSKNTSTTSITVTK